MTEPLILIIEDDPSVLTLTRDLLLTENYRVETATNARAGLEAVHKMKPDLLVLDLNLPDGDGLDLCRGLKKEDATRNLPVFILTARASSDDIVAGLEAGADDYLTKPFNEREFTARIRVILRRNQPGTLSVETELVMGDLKLSPDSHMVLYKGKPLELTLREFDILRVLLTQPGKALTREEIVRYAWGPNTFLVPRVVDVHLGHLRMKLGAMGRKIETVPQVGYRMVP
jgi:two-component system alkaline phosphatase synthesis response regulator PhoP